MGTLMLSSKKSTSTHFQTQIILLMIYPIIIDGIFPICVPNLWTHHYPDWRTRQVSPVRYLQSGGLAGKEAGIVVRWLGLKYIQSGWGMGQNLVLPNWEINIHKIAAVLGRISRVWLMAILPCQFLVNLGTLSWGWTSRNPAISLAFWQKLFFGVWHIARPVFFSLSPILISSIRWARHLLIICCLLGHQTIGILWGLQLNQTQIDRKGQSWQLSIGKCVSRCISGGDTYLILVPNLVFLPDILVSGVLFDGPPPGLWWTSCLQQHLRPCSCLGPQCLYRAQGGPMCNNGFEGPLMAGDRRKDTKLPVGLDPLAFLIDQYPQGGFSHSICMLVSESG